MKGRGRAVYGNMLILLVALTLTIQTAHAVPTWSPPEQITSERIFNSYPSILQLQDGRILLIWESYLADAELYAKTYTPTSGWSTDSRLTTNPGDDVAPSLTQLANGTIMIVYASERAGGLPDIYLARTDGLSLTGETRITSAPESDSLPSVVSAGDGSVWIFWARFMSADRVDIYNKILTSGSSSGEILLTPAGGLNLGPYATRAGDGRIWLTWSRAVSSFNDEIFLRYHDGTTWSAEQQRTSNSASDHEPAIVQDSEGNLRLFWSREHSLPQQEFQDELYYQTSTDNGSTWTAPVRITNDPSGGEKNDGTASVTQATADKSLWLAYASDLGDTWNIWLLKYGPLNIHDVTITNITVTPNRLIRGQIADVTVTILNLGDFVETAQIEIFATNTTTTRVAVVPVTVQPGEQKQYTYPWNTLIQPARYRISANIIPVPGETIPKQLNNSLEDGIVHIRPPGDINDDGAVTILDAVAFGQAYHTRPSMPGWDPRADLNNSGYVDIYDAAILGFWYGTFT